jgi:ADP-ribosylglycohydrolase
LCAQITDDTELAIAQADGLLAGSAADGALDLDALAGAYRRWIDSNPFDIGNATHSAFAGDDGASSGATTAARAAEANAGSKANGAMMRSTPLGVWAHRLPASAAGAAGAADASLSHPNPSTAGANGAYVLSVAHLVAHPGDSEGALAAAEAFLASGGEAYAEAAAWLALAREGELVPYHPQAGFVKIAFVHAFRHLRCRTPFAAALRETLAGGGDTDTNAAIVCGLLGALHGVGGIDAALWQPVLGGDTALGAHARPAWLSPARLPGLAEALLAAAPAELRVTQQA